MRLKMRRCHGRITRLNGLECYRVDITVAMERGWRIRLLSEFVSCVVCLVMRALVVSVRVDYLPEGIECHSLRGYVVGRSIRTIMLYCPAIPAGFVPEKSF